MRANVNCKYCKGLACTHPDIKKFLWIFSPLCKEAGYPPSKCELAVRTPRPPPPQGSGIPSQKPKPEIVKDLTEINFAESGRELDLE